MECAQRRRRRCLFLSVAVIIIIIVVAVVLGLTLRKETDGLKTTFIARCEAFKGKRYDCQTVWGAFEQAYVGQDRCKVPMEAYDPLIAAAPFKHACNRMMFWSKTKYVVHDFTEKKDCFTTMQDTLLGSVLHSLKWCGKEGSSETFTTGCPGWTDCENNPVRSFWLKASAAFADNACDDVTAMLNGSITTPFNSSSIFGSIEVKRFKSPSVKSLTVVLVTEKNSVTNCTNASLKDLQKELDKGIKYNCKEVTEAQIQECSSDPEKPCSSCW
ncbi:ADP-ribosyl cyclase/cyclic ADP-ribose hydrolase 1-like isoform X2 [Siniperca chuatsi]|uniref:ADP-ribosyl cyclase/cyclic ADP-ribose hydrolase 1-like isoform X2 n=1 Tax=Siniperca chuatsi TaxID=119488 RepID=UPI001CE1BC5B|nr:ADP-ribosyl cyclase/cyclic ADP-ribose hydrolase 1-like isoform X2 [Siniperca chuatsi]